MNILLDTNILIYRESNQILSEDLQSFTKLLNKPEFSIFVHPITFKDISKDGFEERKKILESKFNTYSQLESPPDPKKDTKFLEIVDWENHPEDQIDNHFLYAIYKNAVDYLITEDRGIHKNAKNLGLGDRVLLIQDTLEMFYESTKKSIGTPPALREDFVYNLDLSDPIFNSLKDEYPGFQGWFEKISKEQRKCFVNIRPNGKLGALLIYKVEEESMPKVVPPLPKKKRLKICTLKVTHVGSKIGELFLKTSMDIALANDCEQTYLTHFTEDNDRLVSLIEDFGFYKAGYRPWEDGRKEDIFIKDFFVPEEETGKLSAKEISQKYYPSFCDGTKIRKFIVPIQPEYHRRLFTDYKPRQTFLDEHAGEFIVEGNTIRKAYLCHSNTKKIRTGDVLLFYRSKDHMKLTSLGVVEEIHDGLTDANKIFNLVRKRTVYSLDEIEQMAEKETKVILFRHHFHLPHQLDFKYLKDESIVKGSIQSIMQLNHDKYIEIKKEGGIDERFTVD